MRRWECVYPVGLVCRLTRIGSNPFRIGVTIEKAGNVAYFPTELEQYQMLGFRKNRNYPKLYSTVNDNGTLH